MWRGANFLLVLQEKKKKAEILTQGFDFDLQAHAAARIFSRRPVVVVDKGFVGCSEGSNVRLLFVA